MADRREDLDKMVVVDRFRIFYSLSGVDALPRERQVDSDNSGTPDYIEKLAQRFVRADRFYQEDVGLTSPLDSARYRNNAQFIDINILDLASNKSGPKSGIAYDGTPKLNRTTAGAPSLNVLLIDLSGSLSWENKSVEHELFHLYQNGYTFFKNRWYTEGTARWSELVMNGQLGDGGGLPRSVAQKNALFAKSYDANAFWNELILKSDKPALGKNFIKQLLENLAAMDSVAAQERNIDSSHWPEAEQRSAENDPYIWRAILQTIEGMDPSMTANTSLKALFEL